MNPACTCRCPLCRIEKNLIASFSDLPEQELYRRFAASTRNLSCFPDVPALLTHLRASQGDRQTDGIFRELLEASSALPEIVNGLFVLAFVPVIHRSLRQITALLPSLSLEDATQEALNSILQILRSDDLRMRQSHIAFAIARTVKRSAFAWVKRESMVLPIDREISDADFPASEAALFERHAVLRHFLHRCVSKGLLASSELDLLLQFKLGGNHGEDLGDSEGISANAFRQRTKRLMARLRRLAQPPATRVEQDGEYCPSSGERPGQQKSLRSNDTFYSLKTE